MTNPALVGAPSEPESTGRRDLPPAYICAHGAIGPQEFAALGDFSVWKIAVGRTAMGGPGIGTLTGIPTPAATGTSVAGSPPVVLRRLKKPEAEVETLRASDDEPLSTLLERMLRRASVLVLPNRTTSYRIAKRTIDLIGATFLLLLAAPLMFVLAAVIRLDSPGPAIFRQQRVTRAGRIFTFYKFRTMFVDARQRHPELYDYAMQNADFSTSYYKLAEDPRNTRVGRWLRRTTLDELPNLINVLKGDLSLVGPRPELPELVPMYPPEALACFFTKAGMTGLAQVAGRSLLTVDDRITLDTRYVGSQTVLLDIRILFRTLSVVLKREGAF